MIRVETIHIGMLLRTNKGEFIRVESISTKKKHRKVGFHRPEDPCRIHYVRLAQCEKVDIPITAELLERNGWELSNREYKEGCPPDYAYLQKDKWYAQYMFRRNTITIWSDYDAFVGGNLHPDVNAMCDTVEKLTMSFSLVDIEYNLKNE